jgi:hypothetical protein
MAPCKFPMHDKLLACMLYTYSKKGDVWAYGVQNNLHGCIDVVTAGQLSYSRMLHVWCLARVMGIA